MEAKQLSGTQNEIVRRELKRVEKKHGAITPPAVVDAARPEKAALHPHFTWEDAKAAELYRHEEARQLIRSVKLIQPTEPEQERPVIRAFVSVSSHEGEEAFEGRAYISVERAMKDESYSQQVVQRAYEELQAWRARYETLKEFAKVFEAVESLELTK